MQRQELELARDIGKHSQSQRNYEQNLAEMTLELWRVSDCEELVGVTWRVSDCEELVGIFRNTPLPYLDEWKNIDYGLQDKIVIKLNFWIPKKQYEFPEQKEPIMHKSRQLQAH